MRNSNEVRGASPVHYPGSAIPRQYVHVVGGGPPHGQPVQQSGPGAVITLTGVRIRGPVRRAAAPDLISLGIQARQCVALYDPAGSSAVELLDIIGGLSRPRAGQVSVDGVAVHRISGAALERYRGERGLLSARFPLLSSLTVTDNVLAALRTRRADAVARDQAAELLVLSGVGQLAARQVDALSAEQQWRVLLARALLTRPRLMLAEDPAPGLDSRSARRVLDLLMDAHARFGFTLVLATTRLATTARCDRVVSLADGRLTDDELTSDDSWTRGRIDRIG